MKQLVLNDVHIEAKAKMLPFANFNMPIKYGSELEEHKTVRQAVGLFDVSHMGEFLVWGPGALELLQYATTNDVATLTIGKVQYSCMPNGKGGIVDDLLVYRMGHEKYMLVVNASNIEKDWNHLTQLNTFGAEMRNVSDEFCLFALQGPKATDVLKQLTSHPIDQMPYYTFGTGTVADISDIIISATGYTGAGGYELYVPNRHAHKLWAELIKAGQPMGIKPVGLACRDTLRLEKAYCLYGNDIDDQTSPIEAGLGWITKFNKKFVDSELFLKQKNEGVQRKLIGFELLDRGAPRHGYTIADPNGSPIGTVTSGSISPSLGKGIGLGYVPTSFAKPNTNISIIIRDRAIPAMVVKTPFI